jgi:hypothetical protein
VQFGEIKVIIALCLLFSFINFGILQKVNTLKFRNLMFFSMGPDFIKLNPFDLQLNINSD